MKKYILGDTKGTQTWIFLCGLNDDFDGPKARNSRAILNQLGQRCGLRICALEPPTRCADFGNQICWPLSTQEETLSTFDYIQEHTKDIDVCGYIGFSNGGFFLCALAQCIPLDVPIVAIASGGTVRSMPPPNRLILMAGNDDKPYIRKAQDMRASAQGTPLDVTLHTFDGGHVLPEALLEKELPRLINSPSRP